ncbi:class E sortase [Monashia sp. NPDC004114]
MSTVTPARSDADGPPADPLTSARAARGPDRPRRRTGRRYLGLAGESLVALGVLVLLYAVWQVWWTDVDAGAAHQRSVQQLEGEFKDGAAPRLPGQTAPPVPSGKGHVARIPVVARSVEAPPEGTVYAIVRIPRLGPDYAVPVVEGTKRSDLEQGIGHYRGTAWPGQVGNFALAGHRMTYGGPFRDIERVLPGDRVIIETATTYYVYTMGKHTIVDPSHIAAIAPVPERPGARPTVASITLTACHPKYASTWRWIVHGRLEAAVPREQWDPRQWYSSAGGQL